MKILIGTHNKNKFKQFDRSFKRFSSDFELLSLNDIEISDEIEENSNSLLENAKQKAKYYGEKSGIITLSDDLGFFVDALNGDPGVHAKRWLIGTDKDRYIKILEMMKNIPQEKRRCNYRSVIAAYFPKIKDFWTYEQDLIGAVAFKPQEGEGFGYDPIVLIHGKYYSSLTVDEKLNINHRGLGVKKFIRELTLKRF